MIVAALVPMILCAGMAFGQTAKLDDLFNKLKAADPQAAAAEIATRTPG